MRTLLFFIGFLFLALQFSNGQWTQQGADIDGETWGDESGSSVSLNADGSRVAIGASRNDGNGNESGHVRIYEFDGVNWIQLGADIDGEASDNRSGFSVSLNDAGTIVAIGAPYNNPDDSGHVRIYEFNGVDWIQLGSDINGEAAGDQSGYAVSLNGDGTRIAVGARYNSDNGLHSGHIRIYEFNGANWIQLGADIDGEAIDDLFGSAVSLSTNGNRVVAGARWNDGNGDNSGHARVYEFDGVNWIQLGADIDGETLFDESGWSVSISGNGNRVAVGAIHNIGSGAGNSGHVRVYEFDGVNWVQLGMDIDGEAASDESGRAVSLNNNGDIVAIGAPFNDNSGNNDGHVRVYQYNGADWIQLGMDIDGEAQPGTGNHAGSSVSLSNNGNIVAIGAPFNDGNTGVNFDNRGHVQVYTYPLLLYTAIPDPNFEQALIDQGIDSEGILNGQVLTSDIAGVTTLLISNLGIADLTGIEDFSALFSLRCDMNQLTTLDMSNNPNLTNLSCTSNQLTAINVSNNSNLRRLLCQGNQLTELDVTGLALLNSFNAANNPMLSCIAVDNPVNAMAQTGLYTTWVVDDLMVFAGNCGMMARGETHSAIKNTENNVEAPEESLYSVIVYPNPAGDWLHIALPTEDTIANVVFYNLRGERVLTSKTDKINVESLPESLYFVVIKTSGNKVFYRKILISRP